MVAPPPKRPKKAARTQPLEGMPFGETGRFAPSGTRTDQLRLPPSKRRRKSPLRVLGKLLLLSTALVGATATAALGATYAFLDTLRPQAKQQGLDPSALLRVLTPLEGRDPILVLGTDYSYQSGQRLRAGPVRSDTMMVVGPDPSGGKINLISIPRDTRVRLQGRWEKINAAHALGGPEASMEVAGRLLGVRIQRYAAIDTHALEALVDALGGVKVYVERDMYYVDETAHLGINIHKGWHLMNGKQAHQYVRFRHDELGDIGRVQRQQRFLRALAAQALSPATLLRAPALAEVVRRHVRTNVPAEELLRLAFFGARLGSGDLKQVMLPGAFGQASSGFWEVDYPRAEALGQRLLAGKGASDGSKESVKLTVLNGTQTPGLAMAMANRLREAGWNVQAVGEAKDREVRHSRVISQTGHANLMAPLKADMQTGAEEVEASEGDLLTDFTVVVGSDFKP